MPASMRVPRKGYAKKTLLSTLPTSFEPSVHTTRLPTRVSDTFTHSLLSGIGILKLERVNKVESDQFVDSSNVSASLTICGSPYYYTI